MKELAAEAIRNLKKATELCAKLEDENKKLHVMVEEIIDAGAKLRWLEKQSMLLPCMN